jgi:hypothetical protein
MWERSTCGPKYSQCNVICETGSIDNIEIGKVDMKDVFILLSTVPSSLLSWMVLFLFLLEILESFHNFTIR